MQLGEHTLTSISAWREFILHPRNSLGNNFTQISGNAYDVKVDQYSQEVRLASPKDQTLEWQVGVYALHESGVVLSAHRLWLSGGAMAAQ